MKRSRYTPCSAYQELSSDLSNTSNGTGVNKISFNFRFPFLRRSDSWLAPTDLKLGRLVHQRAQEHGSWAILDVVAFPPQSGAVEPIATTPFQQPSSNYRMSHDAFLKAHGSGSVVNRVSFKTNKRTRQTTWSLEILKSLCSLSPKARRSPNLEVLQLSTSVVKGSKKVSKAVVVLTS